MSASSKIDPPILVNVMPKPYQPPEILTYEVAKQLWSKSASRSLVAGNGLSISGSDNFKYRSLWEQCTLSPELKNLFTKLNCESFEHVLKSLAESHVVLGDFKPEKSLITKLNEAHSEVQNGLVRAACTCHPPRPEDNCGKFLSQFTSVFSLSYDLLIYWSIFQSENHQALRPGLGTKNPDRKKTEGRKIDPLAVRNVCFLHGSLVIYRNKAEEIALSYADARKPLLVQTNEKLAAGMFPVFVSEGTSERKKSIIDASPYLAACYQQLEQTKDTVVVWGCSMDPNDDHIWKAVTKSPAVRVFVGMVKATAPDQKLIGRAIEHFGSKELYFFQVPPRSEIWTAKSPVTHGKKK